MAQGRSGVVVRFVPGADVANGMMYEPMENRSSIHIWIPNENIVFTSPVMEALILYSNASIEPTTLAKQFLHFKIMCFFIQLNNRHRLDKRLRYRM